MAVAVFDAHRAIGALVAAGFDEKQARAVTDTVRGAISEGVATKADIAELKADMLKVAVGIVVANAALTVALFKLFGAP